MLTPRHASFLLFSWLMAHLALGTAIWITSAGAETVWYHSGRWLTAVQDADSWKPIEVASARAASGGTGIYQDVFFTRAVKFQYPLTVITLLGGAGRPLLNVITWAATALTAVAAAVLLLTALAVQKPEHARDGAPRVALGCLAAVAVLTFYPVVKAYSLGQVQAIVTALFAGALLAWQRNRRGVAGAAIGLTLLFKPSYAPLLAWGCVRREWRFAAGAAGVALGGVAVSLLRFPLGEQLGYLRVLSFIGQRGEVFHANQSLNGLLNRLVAGGGSLEWHADAFAPYHPLVAFATTAAFIALIVLALAGVGRRQRGTVLDLAIATIACTAAAPVAWEHHYGVLAPAVAATWPSLAAAQPIGRWSQVLLGVAMLVAANYLQFTNRFDGTPFSPLQSYLFISALSVLGLLIAATRARRSS